MARVHSINKNVFGRGSKKNPPAAGFQKWAGRRRVAFINNFVVVPHGPTDSWIRSAQSLRQR